MSGPETLGGRVRELREGQRMEREALAAEVGLSVRYIRAIEEGARVPEKMSTIFRLSRALGVSVDVLLGHPFPIGDDGRPSHPAMPAISAALTWRAAWEPPPAQLPDLTELAARVSSAWNVWQAPGSFTFAIVGSLLPQLIRDVEIAAHAHASEPSAAAAKRVAAELYLLARAYAKWVGHRHLTPGIAERGLAYAEAAGDPALMGASTWNLAQALTSTERPEDARTLAERAIEMLRVDAGSAAAPELLSAVGALHQVAAIASIRGDHTGDAEQHLQEAQRYAARVGDRLNALWLAFGPSNVAVHRLAVEVEQGHARTAARAAQSVLPLLPHLVPVERQFSLLTDAGYATAVAGGDDALAMSYLEEADRLSRERIAASSKPRAAVTLLLRRATKSTRGRILPMAHRLHVA